MPLSRHECSDHCRHEPAKRKEDAIHRCHVVHAVGKSERSNGTHQSAAPHAFGDLRCACQSKRPAAGHAQHRKGVQIERIRQGDHVIDVAKQKVPWRTGPRVAQRGIFCRSHASLPNLPPQRSRDGILPGGDIFAIKQGESYDASFLQ